MGELPSPPISVALAVWRESGPSSAATTTATITTATRDCWTLHRCEAVRFTSNYSRTNSPCCLLLLTGAPGEDFWGHTPALYQEPSRTPRTPLLEHPIAYLPKAQCSKTPLFPRLEVPLSFGKLSVSEDGVFARGRRAKSAAGIGAARNSDTSKDALLVFRGGCCLTRCYRK